MVVRGRRGGGVPYVRCPTFSICTQKGLAQSPVQKGAGKGAGEGQGAHTGEGTQQEGEGVCKHCLHTPSPFSPPFTCKRACKEGRALTGVGRGGGRKRALCPSFPHISTDTCRHVVHVLFYFVFICFYLLYYGNYPWK